jgi:hypothetical protein
VSLYEDFIVVVSSSLFFIFLFLVFFLLVVRCWTCYSFSLLYVCFIDVDKVCRLPLSEEPALAMAFSVARRAAAVPLLLVNGTYRKTIRTYLDSSILQYQLQRLNDHGSLKGSLSATLKCFCS